MENLNKNWFLITLTAVIFGLLGFLLGRQEKHHSTCPMMNSSEHTMFMNDIKHSSKNGNSILFKSVKGDSLEWIENIEIKKEQGDSDEKQIRVKVKSKEQK